MQVSASGNQQFRALLSGACCASGAPQPLSFQHAAGMCARMNIAEFARKYPKVLDQLLRSLLELVCRYYAVMAGCAHASVSSGPRTGCMKDHAGVRAARLRGAAAVSATVRTARTRRFSVLAEGPPASCRQSQAPELSSSQQAALAANVTAGNGVSALHGTGMLHGARRPSPVRRAAAHGQLLHDT